MCEHVIRTVDPNVPYREVTASRGKVQRAEPIAALYEQNRIRHVGLFTELEDQMAAMTGDGYSGDGSPDRCDALVWALSELMVSSVEQTPPRFGYYGSTGNFNGYWLNASSGNNTPEAAVYDGSPASFWRMVGDLSSE